MKLLIFCMFFLGKIGLYAQIKTSNYWKKDRKLGLLVTQNTFKNWNAGGDDSFAGILSFIANYNYKKGYLFWDNKVDARLGMNKKDTINARKTEDILRIESTFGYQKNEKSSWYYSAKFSLRTQFVEGYKYDNKENILISNFFAPAFLFLGVGTQFTSMDKKIKMYLSPFTNKTTFVFDQRLADRGDFGVKKAEKDKQGKIIKSGENTRSEFGIQISGETTHSIMKNVIFWNKAMFYSDYLESGGAIDVNWQSMIKFVVNTYVQANLSIHIIYDEDTKDKTGIARIQFKEILGIGFNYTF